MADVRDELNFNHIGVLYEKKGLRESYEYK